MPMTDFVIVAGAYDIEREEKDANTCLYLYKIRSISSE